MLSREALGRKAGVSRNSGAIELWGDAFRMSELMARTQEFRLPVRLKILFAKRYEDVTT